MELGIWEDGRGIFSYYCRRELRYPLFASDYSVTVASQEGSILKISRPTVSASAFGIPCG